MKNKPQILEYVNSVRNGITVKPSTRDVLLKANEGWLIHCYADSDYINLYHVFERLRKKDKTLNNRTLLRRQIGSSKWCICITDKGAEPPAFALEAKYNPKRGRYIRAVKALEAGNTISVPDKDEAVKVRRAWNLYVPRADREQRMPVTETAHGKLRMRITDRTRALRRGK